MTTPRTTHFNEAELGAYLDEVFPETAGRFVVGSPPEPPLTR